MMARRFFVPLGLFWLATFLIALHFGSRTECPFGANAFVNAYAQNMRVPLFTGFITVGTFLLTLKATILLRIKEVYDTEDYKVLWVASREQNPNETYYGPLRRLGTALVTNVIMALVTSGLQMTVGFISKPWATAVCVAFAATTLGLLIFLWWQIAMGLKLWFKTEEKKKQEQLRTQGLIA